MALQTGPVDVFHIVILGAAPVNGLGIFGNGQRHIRLQSQQPSVQICESDDLLGGQEVQVLLIQAVLLKPAHTILAVTRAFIDGAQAQRGPLLRLENGKIKLHGRRLLILPPGEGAPPLPL